MLSYIEEDFTQTLLHFTERLGTWELCFPLDKENFHSILGNALIHGTYAFYGEGELSENFLYNRKLIGKWELALPSVNKS